MKTVHALILLAFLALFSLPAWSQIDRNLDGIPDVWANRYNATDLLPGDDTDGDGVINLIEGQMGTHPRRASSFMRTRITPLDDDQCRISFPAVSGMGYRLRLTPDLRAAAWQSPDIIFGGAQENTVSLVVGDSALRSVNGVLLRQHWKETYRIKPLDAVKWDTPGDGISWVNQLGSVSLASIYTTAQQVSGWLNAPASGAYDLRFQFAVSESRTSRSQFLLSPDADPDKAVVVAEQFHDQLEGSTVIPVNLVKGNPIYVALRHEVGRLGSGFEPSRVLWRTPGGSAFEEIPSEFLSLYLPEPLPILAPDTDRWAADIAVFHLDSDGDRLTDFEEMITDRNPYFRAFDELNNDYSVIAARYNLFEPVHVRIVDAATGARTYSSRENETKRLRVIGLMPNDEERAFSPISLTAQIGGSATLGQDYLLPGGSTLSFNSYDQFVSSFDIVLLDDNIAEDDETLELSFAYRPDVDIAVRPSAHLIRDDDRPTVGLIVERPLAIESPTSAATIRATRTGNLSQPLTLQVTQSGSAIEGLDYQTINLTIPAGSSETTIAVTPIPDAENEGPETVVLRLWDVPGYDLVPHQVEALVTITDESLSQDSLYVATFRPEGQADTEAWGYATLLLAEDQGSAIVNTRFANLTTPQTAAHIHEGPEGISGPVVEGLPNGEVSDYLWEFGADQSSILQDLNAGRLYANVHTVTYPSGEIRGNFYQVIGSESFTPPASVPTDTGAPGIAAPDAFRFLRTATMGPVAAEAERVEQIGIAAWLDEQIAMPATKRYPFNMALDAKWRVDMLTPERPDPSPGSNLGDTGWLTCAAHAPDQLRQRISHALAQIMVVSRANPDLDQLHLGFADYHDMLGEHSFGNFRDLLYDVARHPLMGWYLSHIQNPKADPERGIFPDENFAREIMQLFSIGLFELHPDGSYRLDPATGAPIPTYGTGEITELARVFTGFGFAKDFRYSDLPDLENNTFYGGGSYTSETEEYAGQVDWITPMKLFDADHDNEPKRIIGGVDLINMDGEAELDAAIDSLFLHANTGPFIANRLIKRLTTANPSRGYVYRVAQAFADNGAGVRGDMAAVVRAIYLDPEARAPGTLTSGKFREPLLLLTQLNRVYEFQNRNTTVSMVANYGDTSNLDPAAKVRYIDLRGDYIFPQRPFFAPTVFNYFDPEFIPTGPLGEARLAHPEGSFLGDVNLFDVLGFLDRFHYRGNSSSGSYAPENPDGETRQPKLPILNTTGDIIDDLDTRLFGGGMSPSLRSALSDLMAASSGLNREQQYRSALSVTLISPEFLSHK